jgi:hypothetical protein
MKKKTLFLVLLPLILSTACKSSSYKYEFCGSIARGEDQGFSGSNEVTLSSEYGDEYVLEPASDSVANTLSSVQSNDQYYGCAYGNEIENGYEGQLLITQKIDLNVDNDFSRNNRY